MSPNEQHSQHEEEWVPLNPGEGFAWTLPGTSLVGVWMGSTTGERGPRGVIETDSGEVIRFNLPVNLRQQVGELEPGSRCKIIYTEDRMSRRGRSYKVFTGRVGDES